jgi:hypothetical protein
LELPSKRGKCNWFGCNKSVFKGGFCEEHGKIKIKVLVTDEKDRKTQERIGKDYGENKGYHKTYP